MSKALLEDKDLNTMNKGQRSFADKFDVSGLVKNVLEKENPSVSDLLEHIARAFNAFGCVLWEVAPGSNLETVPPQGRLFVQASWFSTLEEFAVHNLSIDSSVTGRAILKNQPSNLILDKLKIKFPFIEEYELGPICTIPLTFLDGNLGAVNILRRRSQNRFSSIEYQSFNKFASMIPALYQAIQDKVSLEVLRDVDEILHGTEPNSPINDILPIDDMQQILHRVCKRVASTFHSLEVSVFLEDPDKTNGIYKWQAGTWDDVPTKRYTEKTRRTLTGWCIRHTKSVNIIDLNHFKDDMHIIQQEYPNIKWSDSNKYIDQVRKSLGLDESQSLPPLSFMCAPVMVADKLFGIIRCFTATSGPYYYAKRELNLLELIAGQISHFWSAWLHRKQIVDENKNWEQLIDSISKLNKYVQDQLFKGEPDEIDILNEAIRLTKKVISGADILDIRLLDKSSNKLEIKSVYGKDWNKFPDNKKNTFLLEERSIGSLAFKGKKLILVPDVDKHPDYVRIFPHIKQMICAPIKTGRNVYGVLDILSKGKIVFTRHPGKMAELIGHQLGLYIHLVRSIGELNQTHTKLQSTASRLGVLQKDQILTMEDLAHQLKGPINFAQRRAQSAAEAMHNEENRRIVQSISGLCRRARRVTISVSILADILQGKEINANLTSMDRNRLKSMLLEAAQDTFSTTDVRKNMEFIIRQGSFDRREWMDIRIDFNLIEQAVNNLLDNASKYSYPNTRVYVYSQMLKSGRLCIAVSNTGLRIQSDEVNRCKERHWRSDYAKWATAEGSGIGLWIVDHIMKTHGGELIIDPTNSDNITLMRLAFPMKK